MSIVESAGHAAVVDEAAAEDGNPYNEVHGQTLRAKGWKNSGYHVWNHPQHPNAPIRVSSDQAGRGETWAQVNRQTGRVTDSGSDHYSLNQHLQKIGW